MKKSLVFCTAVALLFCCYSLVFANTMVYEQIHYYGDTSSGYIDISVSTTETTIFQFAVGNDDPEANEALVDGWSATVAWNAGYYEYEEGEEGGEGGEHIWVDDWMAVDESDVSWLNYTPGFSGEGCTTTYAFLFSTANPDTYSLSSGITSGFVGYFGSQPSSPFAARVGDYNSYAILDGETTHGAPAPPVPIPGALWLFGSGLLGLVAVRRRKVEKS